MRRNRCDGCKSDKNHCGNCSGCCNDNGDE